MNFLQGTTVDKDMCMDYLNDENVVSDIQELLQSFESAEQEVNEYVQFMKETFLSCSCLN